MLQMDKRSVLGSLRLLWLYGGAILAPSLAPVRPLERIFATVVIMLGLLLILGIQRGWTQRIRIFITGQLDAPTDNITTARRASTTQAGEFIAISLLFLGSVVFGVLAARSAWMIGDASWSRIQTASSIWLLGLAILEITGRRARV